MAVLIKEDKKSYISDKQHNDPYQSAHYRTLVDKSGYYSHYASGGYTIYTSYEYDGEAKIITFDADTG